MLASDVKMMATPEGTFVELPAPMPVGTRLILEEDGIACPVRVERVVETRGAMGVFVLTLAAESELAQSSKPATAAETSEAPATSASAGEPEDGKRQRRKTGRMRKVTR